MASRAAVATPAALLRLARPVLPWNTAASHRVPIAAAAAVAPIRGFALSRRRLASAPDVNAPPPSRPRGTPVRLSPEAEALVSGQPPASESARPDVPQRASHQAAYYQLSFTCVPCGHRSHHNISKQGYHTGSILITCPGCRDRHVISDHLQIFGDRKVTVEDLMRERGRLVKRGSLGEDGDVEFWPDDQPDQPAGDSGAARES